MSIHKENKPAKQIPQTVEEDLNSITESELLKDEKKLHPMLKRTLIIFGGLIIVFLFLSLIYLQYPLFNIIQGRIESRNADNNVLLLKDISIVFSDDAMNSLQNSFSVNQEVETSRCLKGTLDKTSDKTVYLITEVYTPTIYDQSFRHVTSAPCSNDTLIMFHTHPYKSCVASSTDLNTLKATKSNNPNIIMIIMCEPDRFSTYE